KVEQTVGQVRQLTRDLCQRQGYALESSPEPATQIADIQGIPCYVVGFKGHKTIDGLVSRLENTPSAARPHGALVIESGAFVGVTGTGIGEEGVYRLIAELAE